MSSRDIKSKDQQSADFLCVKTEPPTIQQPSSTQTFLLHFLLHQSQQWTRKTAVFLVLRSSVCVHTLEASICVSRLY